MQIIITVDEAGRATTQVLGGATTTGETVATNGADDAAALDGGTAPDDVGEEIEAEASATAMALGSEALDGGAAPFEMDAADEPSAPQQSAEDAGAAPRVLDLLPPDPGPPRLRPVD